MVYGTSPLLVEGIFSAAVASAGYPRNCCLIGIACAFWGACAFVRMLQHTSFAAGLV